MSGKPFDRQVINQLERPLSTDVNQISTYADQALRELFLNIYSSRMAVGSDLQSVQPPTGAVAFIGAGFRARGATSTLQVWLDPGLGFLNDGITGVSVGSVSGVDDREAIKPLSLTARETITVPAADASNPRIDLIEVKVDRRLTDPSSRDVMNPSSGAFQPGTVLKTLTYNQEGRSTVNGVGSINYKTGTPAATPTGPVLDSGYLPIAQVYVNANATAIGATGVMDLRRMLFEGGALRISGVAVGSPSGNCEIQSLVAPPGVEATIINQIFLGAASTQPVYEIIIKAGNSWAFRPEPSPGGAPGGVDNSSTYAAGSIVTRQATATNIYTLQWPQYAMASNGSNISQYIGPGSLSAARPPLSCMVGQPLLRCAMPPGTTGSLIYHFEINVQY